MKKTAKHFFVAAFLAASLSFGFYSTPAYSGNSNLAATALEQLLVKGKAPKTGYERSNFSDGWSSIGRCSVRNLILKRDLTNVTYREECVVDTGILKDPYTGKLIHFKYGVGTSMAVQIDHVVALSDAWQKGAQQLSAFQRKALFNDPLNLLAVDGPTNSSKGDGDAASWLPPSKAFRCTYVARQIAVKVKYRLWVSKAEKSVMKTVLDSCSKQKLPIG